MTTTRTSCQNLFVIFLLGVLGSSSLFAQLNESLDPLILNTGDRESYSLNGIWQTIVDPLENGYYKYGGYEMKEDGFFKNAQAKSKSDLIEYNFETSETLMVPGDWNTQKEKLFYYEGTIWYKKDFNYVKKEGKRVFLYFGAVNYEAIVSINGEKIGKHTGGFTPFNIEITDKVVSGNNFLVLKVDNQRKAEGVPTLNLDWWNYGGITRDVKIVEVPNAFIQDFSIHLVNGTHDQIAGNVSVQGAEKTEVTISIPALGLLEKVTTVNGKASFSFKGNPQLWTPENPKLYEVNLKTSTDKLSDKIGFRSIETKGEDILLNGKSIFLRGICLHEEAPFRSGRAYSEEDARILLGWAKELGCNYVRLAHYTHNEYMMREADRLGLMVWSEIPVYWTVQWENEESLQNALNQITESITRDKNRASIVTWSVANETPVGEARTAFLKKLIDRARSLDNTRLITAATQSLGGENKPNEYVLTDPLSEYLDIIGVNYYCGWYDGLPDRCGEMVWKSKYNKPVVMSEFGAGALYGMHGDELTRWSEEFQVNVYKENLKMIDKIPFLRGITPWLLMDFHSPRRPLPNIQDNYNRKGLISEKGQKKAAFFTLQKYYKSLPRNY